MQAFRTTRTVWMVCAAVALAGCHADKDDPEELAKELSDPVRREWAVGHLQRIYGKQLAEAKGDRSAKKPAKFADITHEHLTKVYIEHPEDTQNGYKILQLMKEMRDPRTLPALLKALDWQTEVNEDHAITAARTLAEIDIPDGKKGEVIDKLGKALERVDGDRGIDNRMRKAFIEALGAMNDKRATPALIEVATTQKKSQNFLFNRLAAQQLAKLEDPRAIPAMIKGLYLFAPNNPAMRMNDVAASALVAIGKPALDPMLEVLAGKNKTANSLAKAYIAAIRERDEQAAAEMDPRAIVSYEATFTLGKLGFRKALPALLKEAQVDHEKRRNAAAIALVSINREPSDTPKIVETMQQVYKRAEKISRPQLLVAMQHLYADEAMPFLLEQARQEETELPDIRVIAFSSYALLGTKSEMKGLEQILKKSDPHGFRPAFEKSMPAIKAAKECDQKLSCWIGKLGSDDKLILRKAATMLGRFGRGNSKAVDALVPLLGHRDLEVRFAALNALDHIAVDGSQKAIDKLEELQDKEQGRSVWNNFKREALPLRYRLKARAQA